MSIACVSCWFHFGFILIRTRKANMLLTANEVFQKAPFTNSSSYRMIRQAWGKIIVQILKFQVSSTSSMTSYLQRNIPLVKINVCWTSSTLLLLSGVFGELTYNIPEETKTIFLVIPSSLSDSLSLSHSHTSGCI